MTGWVWISREAVESFHSEQLVEHGGLAGLKDENSPEAALARPTNKAEYGDPDAFTLAAAYLFGIAKNHPFSDGNKRSAFLAAYAFLRLNGYDFDASQGEVVTLVLGVAAGEIDEDGAAAFFSDHCRPV